jgi:hypothetical protein
LPQEKPDSSCAAVNRSGPEIATKS